MRILLICTLCLGLLRDATAADDAQFVGIELSDQFGIDAGFNFPATIRMKNTGTTTWDNSYWLSSESMRNNTRWGTNALRLTRDVAPGEEAVFDHWFLAPTNRGLHVFAWRMMSGGTTRFGEIAITNLAVGAGAKMTPGDLVVVQAGDGQTAQSTNGSQIFIKTYSRTGGRPRFELSLPTVGPEPFILGANGFAGKIALTADGRCLVMAAYNTNAPFPVEVTNSLAPRAIATINSRGQFKIESRISSGPAASGATINGGNVRQAVGDANGNFWFSVQAGGIYHAKAGVNGAVNIYPAANQAVRHTQYLNGRLFFMSAFFEGTTVSGIAELTGDLMSPSTATMLIDESPSQIPGFTSPSGSPRGFQVSPDYKIAYICDVRGFQNGAGLFRFNGTGEGTPGSWTFAYRLTNNLPAPNSAFDDIAVDFTGAEPVIFALNSDPSGNYILKGTDTGPQTQFTIIATSPGNSAFRGITFAPLDEPTSSLSVSRSGSNVTVRFVGGVLEHAPAPQGPWDTILPQPESPYTFAADGEGTFYRLRLN